MLLSGFLLENHMHFKNILFSFVFFLLLTSDLLGKPIVLKSNSLIYDEYLKRVEVTGNVSFELENKTVTGNHFLIYTDNNLLISSGNASILTKDQSFVTSKLLIDLNKEEAKIHDINIVAIQPNNNARIYISIKELIDKKTVKKGSISHFTFCKNHPPHFYLKSWKFLYYPDKSIHLLGAYLRNDLSFFPFSVIPIPIPLLEWIPIPYYYYQLGKRKVILNFPTIGEKKTHGWGLFVQNRIDYKYKNEKESSLFLDWYEAKDNRSGEFGYGIHHHYGNKKNYGSVYLYNYNFTQGNDSKQNLIYKIKHSYSKNKFHINTSYKRENIDERINSQGSSDSTYQMLSLQYDKQHFPLLIDYSKNGELLSLCPCERL